MERSVNVKQSDATSLNLMKLIGYSAIGILMFFIPITIGEKTTIPLDHLVTFITATLGSSAKFYALAVIIIGGLRPFAIKTWNKDIVTTVFSVFKLIGIGVAFMAVFNVGPAFMFEPDMVPFLLNKLVIPVGLIVPIGSVFLAFLVGYGLLEFIGVLVQPVMRPIWKTPGRSAVDAVASFVGSYSIGLLITNRVFKEGKYTIKEASIIATGFSTVSATFMIIVAKTLGIMEHWNLYFWATLVITFIVTAITARIYPLNKKSDNYYSDVTDPEPEIHGNLLKNAVAEGLKATSHSLPIGKNIVDNFKDGFIMAMGILPTILSVGLFGLILAKYTPVFDIMGYIFYPFTWALQIPEPLLAAKASALEIAEMFLPALLVVDAPIITKFIIAIVSVSSILFFSASIPCVLSTEIPLTLKDILIIWYERTVFTLILATPVAFLMF